MGMPFVILLFEYSRIVRLRIRGTYMPNDPHTHSSDRNSYDVLKNKECSRNGSLERKVRFNLILLLSFLIRNQNWM